MDAFEVRFNSFWRTGNASKLASLYDPFTAFINTYDGSALYGRQAVDDITKGFMKAYPQLTDYPDYTLGTQNCEYIFKFGHFYLNANKKGKTYICNMVLKKQPAGSKEPYLVIRDDIYWDLPIPT